MVDCTLTPTCKMKKKVQKYGYYYSMPTLLNTNHDAPPTIYSYVVAIGYFKRMKKSVKSHKELLKGEMYLDTENLLSLKK